jgi:hypothetical protein
MDELLQEKWKKWSERDEVEKVTEREMNWLI